VFYWFEQVVYLDSISKVPETTEKLGYFEVFTDNERDAQTFKILKDNLNKVSYRSVVQSAADANLY
jgi:hypothetical protein